MFELLSGMVITLAGSGEVGTADGTAASATFRSPSSVAVDASDVVFVADCYNNNIRRITSSGV